MDTTREKATWQALEEDLRELGVENWKDLVQYRDGWRQNS